MHIVFADIWLIGLYFQSRLGFSVDLDFMIILTCRVFFLCFVYPQHLWNQKWQILNISRCFTRKYSKFTTLLFKYITELDELILTADYKHRKQSSQRKWQESPLVLCYPNNSKAIMNEAHIFLLRLPSLGVWMPWEKENNYLHFEEVFCRETTYMFFLDLLQF